MLFPLATTISVGAEAPTAAELIDRHAKENSPVWSDGNVATFFYLGEVERVDLYLGGKIQPLTRLPQSKVWTTTMTLPDLEHAVFSYNLIAAIPDAPTKHPLESPRIWRGPKAPPPVREQTELKGDLKLAEIESLSLGAKRSIAVYRPRGHDPKMKTRVIYATDGQGIKRFAQLLEPLIENRQVPPVVIVGVHCGRMPSRALSSETYDFQSDPRVQEYLPGVNEAQFAKHESFFCSEVPTWAETEFGVSTDRADRAVFGCSNGGRFVLEMGRKHPDFFGYVFGFSVAGIDQPLFEVEKNHLEQSRYYLAAGTWEEGFHHRTFRYADDMKQLSIPVKFSSRISGHDLAMWGEEFVAAVLWAFAYK
jgi:enterochelin esterase-like enzyme